MLTIATLPPLWLTTSGMAATGKTCRLEAADDQQIAVASQRERYVERRRHRFSEQDDARLQDRMVRADGAAGQATLLRVEVVDRNLHAYFRSAGRADGNAEAAVHLEYELAAGGRVQSIDVLSDDRANDPELLELRQSEMARVRLHATHVVESIAVEAPRHRRVAAEGADLGELLEVSGGPEPVQAAKVGNAALGADTHASQERQPCSLRG